MKKIILNVLFLSTVMLSQQCLAGFEDSAEKERAEKAAREEAKMLAPVGQTFYAHFPRPSCKQYFGIQSRPSVYDQQKYTSDTPKRFFVEEAVVNPRENSGLYYYRIKLEDGTEGYLADKNLTDRVGDPSSAYSLEHDCWFQLNPQELQSRLDKFESDRLARINAEEEKRRLEIEEKQKQADAEAQANLASQKLLIKKAPALLKKYSVEDICTVYGRAIRGETVYNFEGVPNITKLVINEARRRNLVFNVSLVKKEHIKIGMTECQLYASWGFPSAQNRTVGSWGVHIQHVYDGNYAYTENGIVTSFQN